MTDETLFDLFTAHGVTRQEIVKLDLATITRQIGELRENLATVGVLNAAGVQLLEVTT